MRTDFKVTIDECTKELDVRERIKLKDFTDAVSFDSLITDGTPLTVEVAYIAQLSIHNEHSHGDHDYKKTMVVDTAGTKYHTGSSSFLNAISDIRDELLEAGETGPFTIEVFKKPSNNYKDKSFITCVLA